ncbi:hypothetical protein V5799_009834 [Amblyomma americanum]|uniref:Hydroxysteroid 17-beta dehydrogenase 11 n=1 Tax=Amblyomma americanum TaxID=6943 RepID=A0AAQ4FAH2_AMBAM
MTLSEFVLVLVEFMLLNVQCLWIALREAVHWPAPAAKSVAGKVVLITGSGHGVGRELALRFARLGARLVLVDIHKVRKIRATERDPVLHSVKKGARAHALKKKKKKKLNLTCEVEASRVAHRGLRPLHVLCHSLVPSHVLCDTLQRRPQAITIFI